MTSKKLNFCVLESDDVTNSVIDTAYAWFEVEEKGSWLNADVPNLPCP